MFLSKKRKGMALAVNTIVILVILLVLVLVVLILVSRGASNFTDLADDKINVSGGVTNCEILCWECCHDPDESDCSNPFLQKYKLCNCIDNKPTATGC
ncbi:MAG: hypothetical protein KAS90_01035 [Candidatus Aenigmarchaeota archaeon]|nr:hypothetical protein [Candidatus Aenigmarchaeota archaeon]